MEKNNWLESLTAEEIQSGTLPLAQLLQDSFYYPSCGFDGGIVKDCNTLGRSFGIQSFVYCDYATGEEAFMEMQNSFLGYHVLSSRPLQAQELTPNGWVPQFPPKVSLHNYQKYKNSWKPFGHWTVYQRNEDRDESLGPRRFSLLYIGGEGVATYQALYWSNGQHPKALAIIQPGTGFGLNWTDFRKKDYPLHWVVKNNPFGVPELVYFGGYGNGYDHFSWEEYEPIRKIRPYYHPDRGEVQILKIKE